MAYEYLATHLFDNAEFVDLEYNFEDDGEKYYQDVNFLVERLKAGGELERYDQDFFAIKPNFCNISLPAFDDFHSISQATLTPNAVTFTFCPTKEARPLCGR